MSFRSIHSSGVSSLANGSARSRVKFSPLPGKTLRAILGPLLSDGIKVAVGDPCDRHRQCPEAFLLRIVLCHNGNTREAAQPEPLGFSFSRFTCDLIASSPLEELLVQALFFAVVHGQSYAPSPRRGQAQTSFHPFSCKAQPPVWGSVRRHPLGVWPRSGKWPRSGSPYRLVATGGAHMGPSTPLRDNPAPGLRCRKLERIVSPDQVCLSSRRRPSSSAHAALRYLG